MNAYINNKNNFCYCPNCGNKLDIYNSLLKYCNNCGFEVVYRIKERKELILLNKKKKGIENNEKNYNSVELNKNTYEYSIKDKEKKMKGATKKAKKYEYNSIKNLVMVKREEHTGKKGILFTPKS